MAIQPVPNYTPIPTPVIQRGDRTTFSNRVDAAITWLQVAPGEVKAMADVTFNNATEAVAAASTAVEAAGTAVTSATTALSTAPVNSVTPPLNPAPNAIWIHSDTLRKYTYTPIAGGSYRWIEAEANTVYESPYSAQEQSFTAYGVGVQTNVAAQLRGDNVATPARRGFYTTDGSGVNIHRFRDRLFVGESVKHSGSIIGPYGNTWLATKVATWAEKNAQVSMLSSEEKIGLLTGVQATNASGASAIGLASFSYNERTNGTARAIYADVTHTSPGTASYGLEIAVNNRGTDVQTNSYSLSGGCIGVHMTPEGGSGYTLGDTDSPAAEATAPGTLAINVGAGSGGTANKRWNLGLRIGSNALTTDGSGNAVAVSMGQGHTLEWMASSTVYGARIRSRVTAVAGQDVGVLFENNLVSVKGTGLAATIADFAPVASGVNNVRFTNAAAGGFPSIAAVGAGTDIGMFFDAKGGGNIRFRTNGGTTEQFRVSNTADAVNFLGASGGATGNPPRIDALGSNTDIDIVLAPKGTGSTRILADLRVSTVGKGLRVAEGTNAKQGVSTLVGGTVTVANTSVTASSRIFLSTQSLGTVGAPKAMAITAKTAGTSFTITSADATDTSTVAWQIFEPA